MLGLDETQKPAASQPGDLIKDGSDASFMADVIDASREVPVIVAPGCARSPMTRCCCCRQAGWSLISTPRRTWRMRAPWDCWTPDPETVLRRR